MKVLGGNDKSIGGLGAAGALAGTDILPIVQSGTTVRSTLADVKAFFDQGVRNALTGTTQVVSGNTDTYLTNSDCAIPNGRLQAKTMYRLQFNVVKTGAGVAAPVLNLRVGTAGTTADSSRCAFTFAAQTAVIDEGMIEVWATFKSVGSGTSAVLSGLSRLSHRLVTTGLNVTAVNTFVINTGGGFDSTVSSLKIGASLNVGASGNWTISLLQADLLNLT